MSNQIKSSPELEAALNGVTNASELRETLIQKLVADGHIIKTRDGEFNTHLQVRQQQTPDASLPANGFKYEKELTFDPESGRRNLMLRANTLADLQALENQILGQ